MTTEQAIPQENENNVHHHLKILIVEDVRITLTLIKRYLEKLGHQVVTASNGIEGVDVYTREQPDLVLLDLMMPEMNGYDTTLAIRELDQNKDRWVPIIMMSAMNEISYLTQGLDCGADDYLFKPVNFVVLEAKIKAMQRIADMQDQLAIKMSKLADYYYVMEHEKELANRLLNYVSKKRGIDDSILKYTSFSQNAYSGDLITASRSPNDSFFLLLADSYGVGLPALVNTLPIGDLFYQLVEAGHQMPYIIQQLNDFVYQMELGATNTQKIRVAKSVIFTIICVDVRANLVSIWNAGNPPCYLFDNHFKRLNNPIWCYPALGELPSNQLNIEPQIFDLNKISYILAFNSGFVNIEERYQIDLAKRIFMQQPQNMNEYFDILSSQMAGLIEKIKTSNQKQFQDASFIMIDCQKAISILGQVPQQNMNKPLPVPTANIANVPIVSKISGQELWNLQLKFSTQELKYLDIPALLMSVIKNVHILKTHMNQIFILITELFANALDHGILGLDSSLKLHPEGFEEYMKNRTERLEKLKEAELEVCIKTMYLPDHSQQTTDLIEYLVLRFKDSGKGFPWQKYFNNSSTEIKQETPVSTAMPILPFGRGILLIKNIASKIEYRGIGNEAIIYYKL